MATTNTFVWSGLDKNGRKNQGEIVAASQAMAKAQLRKQGIAAKTVKKKAKPLLSFGQKKIKPADVAVFTRQMATMMKGRGTPGAEFRYRSGGSGQRGHARSGWRDKERGVSRGRTCACIG